MTRSRRRWPGPVWATAILAALAAGCAPASPTLDLPPRPVGAPGGAALEAIVRDLDPGAREARLRDEILRGNVPDRLRTLVPVDLEGRGDDPVTVRLWVVPDYLAVGSDDDAWLVPLSPGVGQEIADALGMSLPTTRIVDAVWGAARNRLEPSPIDPSPEMTTTPVFLRHSRTIDAQREGLPPERLTAGHKKDVVVSTRLDPSGDRVAIYGWHRLDGEPIQPLYLGHTDQWVDYSHGIRLISRRVLVDGSERDLHDALRDPALHSLLSEEGAVHSPRYRARR